MVKGKCFYCSNYDEVMDIGGGLLLCHYCCAFEDHFSILREAEKLRRCSVCGYWGKEDLAKYGNKWYCVYCLLLLTPEQLRN